LSKLNIRGTQRIRDLWQHKDLGDFTDTFETTVPPHGVVLVRLFPKD
jgi:alpha-galactosidase